MILRTLVCALLACLAAPALALADAAPFDLAGPVLQVTVAHAGATLPIGEVPNLTAGDQLSIKADLPTSQSVHYLLVAAFLRGVTNPPPDSWFYKAETWNHKGRGGIRITVPPEAQQLIVFLAPQTGGDFHTLVGAVQGRPGAFVRASQDLNQASLDRSRLDAFASAIGKRDPGEPDRLKTVSPLLARSLLIKLNTDCFQKIAELQVACLMQGQDSLILNDGHSTSIVEALTSGPSADLAFQISATPQASFGYYSPYVAAVLDIARIMNSLGTAQYQYIPAIAVPHDDRLALLLNTPPSFHNPLSVLVAALPPVEPPQSPPLQPVDPKKEYCAARTDLVLPVEGAPLVYSTDYAHDMTLRVRTKDGATVDLPVKADPEKGGLVVDTQGFDATRFGSPINGTLKGEWGFQPFDGPSFHLGSAQPQPWRLSDDDGQSLVVGRDDTVHLEGPDVACVDTVALEQPSGETQPLDWTAANPFQLSVTAPLSHAEPGAMTLLVRQFGMREPDRIPVQAFSQTARLDSFALHAGDSSGVLKGRRLDEVAALTLAGVEFKPGALSSAGGDDELTLSAATDASGLSQLKATQTTTARVALNDGRTLKLKVAIASSRPQATLIAMSVRPDLAAATGAIALTGPNELPQGAQLTFSVRAEPPTRFSTQEAIEIGDSDGIVLASLTPGAGLTLEDNQVGLATLDTGKALSPTAFGALRFRVVLDGSAGDWRPLAMLVRLPELGQVKCREGREKACELSGANLFLIDAVANDASFAHPVKVPEGFPGSTIPVPHPVAGRLYIKLRDDPGVINSAIIHMDRTPTSAAATRPGP